MKNIHILLIQTIALFCLGASSTMGQQVSALGRLLPADGVINVWGPSGIQIEAIHVKQGDWVKAGDLLVTLSNKSELEAEVTRAAALLEQSKETLELENRFQEVRMSGLKHDYENALARLAQTMKNRQIVSPQVIEEREEAVNMTKNALDLAEVSREKILLGMRQAVELNQMNLDSAKAMAKGGEILAPVEGKVLIIRLNPGDTLGKQELIKIADTREMIASAEVYETDIGKIKPGQNATVKSVALETPLTGKVISVGHMIYRNTVDTLDPRSLSNSRVVEATILLDNPEPVADLSYLQVDVFIQQ